MTEMKMIMVFFGYLKTSLSFQIFLLKNLFNTSPNSAILSCLFYIAAYCAHSLIKFVNGCENCLTYITISSDFVINVTNCGENDSANVAELLVSTIHLCLLKERTQYEHKTKQAGDLKKLKLFLFDTVRI
jgi:hypothetical protein